MITAVGPRWPRAFTSIGIGACALYALFFTLVSNSLAKSDRYHEDVSATDVLLSLSDDIPSNIIVAIAFAGLFVSYVAGELLIQFGSWCRYTGDAQIKHLERRVRYAKSGSSLLFEQFERRETSIELIIGCSTLACWLAMLRFMFLATTQNWSGRGVMEIVFLLLFAMIALVMVWRLENISESELDIIEQTKIAKE